MVAATTEGNRKAHQTLRERLGEEGYLEHMATIGARGGKAQVPKGFAISKKQRNRRPEDDQAAPDID